MTMAPVESVSVLAMFVIGLLGSGHCVGMCGGIATGLGFAAQGKRSLPLIAGYNIGRIASYASAGILVASLGYWGSSYLALGSVLRIAAAIILVLMGFYLAGWWGILGYLEKAGSHLWRLVQPLGKKLMPVTSFGHALVLGALWGWLPCGLVYTALAYAATSANPLGGALMMVAFGLGTAPAMIAGSVFSDRLRRLMQSAKVRNLLAVMMIALGVWALVDSINHLRPLWGDQGGGAEGGSHHHHH
ncbi:MAG: sulfite exporter TauE/SafE family protein [Porticoccaceae bacterium]|nr:sulfite exporter TauE/SafE family protein [Porticoccaceae bacterium]